jgi:hypothetical protein
MVLAQSAVSPDLQLASTSSEPIPFTGTVGFPSSDSSAHLVGACAFPRRGSASQSSGIQTVGDPIHTATIHYKVHCNYPDKKRRLEVFDESKYFIPLKKPITRSSLLLVFWCIRQACFPDTNSEFQSRFFSGYNSLSISMFRLHG